MFPSECARAASAAEARFRIDVPIRPARAARVIALDDGAASVVRRVATREWASARFFVSEGLAPGVENGGSASADALLLRGVDGTPALLSEELTGADVVFMIATEDSGAAGALALGLACAERGVMTAGLVLGDGYETDEAVAALRPHARVLLPTADEGDVTELLTALRA